MRAWIVGLTFAALQAAASAVTLGEFPSALAVPATANYSANNWNALKPIKGVKWRDATVKDAPSAFAQEADVALDGHVSKTCRSDDVDVEAALPATLSGQATVAAPAAQSAGTLHMNSYYTCSGERVAVLRCRSDADDAYCSVQYPDRKSAATGGMTPELAERRGDLVKKLQGCQQPKS